MLFSQPTLVGHRGVAAVAPENTLIGFQRAAQSGCQWVEFDVQLSADDVPMVFHDTHLTRIAGTKTAVAQMSAEQLTQVDVGNWFSPAYHGETMPTLVDVLATLTQLNLSANVEIKSLPGDEVRITDAVVACLKQHWPASQPIVISSFSTVVMQHLLEIAPMYPRAWLIDKWHSDWQQRMTDYQSIGLHVADAVLTRARCQAMCASQHYLLAYTVNQPQRAKALIDWGVTAICTDDPQLLQPIMA